MVAENTALCARNKELEAEIVDLNIQLDPGYCPECGSCGETGCCPPTKCKTVQGLYCDYNLRDYDIVCNEAWAYGQFVEHIKTLAHCASLVGNNVQLQINAQCSHLMYLLKQVEEAEDRDLRRTKIAAVEEFIKSLTQINGS